VLSLQRKCWGAVVTALLLVCLGSKLAGAQSSSPPTDSDTLPKVPSSLIREISPYTSMSSYGLAGWHPSRREIWAKAITPSYTGIAKVEAPGESPQVEVLFPANIYEVYYSPNAKAAVYVKDADGNEQFQVYSYEPSSRKSTLLSDGKSRNTEPVWSNKGDWVIYSSNRRNGTDTDLYVVKAFEPNTTRLLAQDKGYLKVFDWSPDDRQALFYNWLSANESYLYTVDVTSGEKTLLTPTTGSDKVSYDYAQFSSDGCSTSAPPRPDKKLDVACDSKFVAAPRHGLTRGQMLTLCPMAWRTLQRRPPVDPSHHQHAGTGPGQPGACRLLQR